MAPSQLACLKQRVNSLIDVYSIKFILEFNHIKCYCDCIKCQQALVVLDRLKDLDDYLEWVLQAIEWDIKKELTSASFCMECAKIYLDKLPYKMQKKLRVRNHE